MNDDVYNRTIFTVAIGQIEEEDGNRSSVE